MNSFAIVTHAQDGQIMIVEAAAFTENQQAAILHMLARAGMPCVNHITLPPEPAIQVHEVDLPSGVSRVAERVGQPAPAPAPVTERASVPLAGSAEQAMAANREAAKAQAKERAQQARGMGYTGDLCQQCGSDRMKRNGSCLCCEGCGATTGCS